MGNFFNDGPKSLKLIVRVRIYSHLSKVFGNVKKIPI
jgi:hypothetical protein